MADLGPVRLDVRRDEDGNVVIDFGTPIQWMAVQPAHAVAFAYALLKAAGVSTVKTGGKDG